MKHKIKTFSQLTINGAIQVKLIQSEEWSIAIEGPDTNMADINQIYHYEGKNLIIDGCVRINQTIPSIGDISGSRIGSIVQVGVNHGTININLDRQEGTNGVLIIISTPIVPEINLKGSGTVVIDGFHNQTLDYCLDGSGDIIHHNVKVKKALLRVHGSGDIDLKGVAREVLAKLVGSGDIDVSACDTDHAEVSLTGSGDIHVNAKIVCGSICGSGDLHCTSTAKEIDVKVVGSGKVRQNRVQRK